MKYFFSLLMVMAVNLLGAQDKSLPYYEIPDFPEKYSAGGVAARMVDGLGFRYYWATEGLREQDLVFKPSVDARTCGETIEHIYGLSLTILNATTLTINVPGQNKKLSFAEARKATLENLKSASDRLRASSDLDMEKYRMVFQRGETKTEYPFWNEINGPIADAIWHVGQVISFRRSSGNPYNSNAGVLTGKVRE